MMPGKTLRKISPSASPAEREVAVECALQLRRIGDKWDLRQKFLNLLVKLFCPQT